MKTFLAKVIATAALLCSAASSVLASDAKHPPSSNPSNLHSFSLPSLQHKGEISLAEYKDRLLLLSFFEPNCKWCHKQMKAFNQLQKNCSHVVQPIAVGVHGRRSELQQELRKARVKFPAFAANKELLLTTGDINVTPITLVIDEKGEFIAPLRGYIPLTQLTELLPDCSV